MHASNEFRDGLGARRCGPGIIARRAAFGAGVYADERSAAFLVATAARGVPTPD
ncbi:hypothetical protein D3C78_1652050 [compost metagenome]